MTGKQKREHESRLAKLRTLYDCAARESAEADEGVKAAQRIKESADRLRLEAKQKLADEEVYPDIERMPEALRSRLCDAAYNLHGLTAEELRALALRGVVKKKPADTSRSLRYRPTPGSNYNLTSKGQQISDVLLRARKAAIGARGDASAFRGDEP